MEYELAKNLKEAGFWEQDFLTHRNWKLSDYAWLPCHEITREDREKLWIPTLSELIDACGEDLLCIERCRAGGVGKHLGWIAVDTNKEVIHENDYEYADTPEEAVANLWLALVKKHQLNTKNKMTLKTSTDFSKGK